MIKNTTSAIGYICNDCGKSVICEINFFERKNEFIKVNCSCGKSGITLKIKSDNKVRFTVPCILCGTDHIYNLSLPLFFKKDVFRLTCSLLNVDICALGDVDNINKAMRVLFDEINHIFMMYAEADIKPYEKRKSSKSRKDNFEILNPPKKNNAADNILDLLKDIDGEFNSAKDFDDDDDWYFDDDDDEYNDEYDDEDLLDKCIDQSDFQFHAGKKNTSSETAGETVKLEFKDRQNFENVLFYITNLVRYRKVYCDCFGEGDISITLGFDSIQLSCKNCGTSRNVKAATSLDVENIAGCEQLFLD